jgi:thiamine pyrophosphate-dependent acetolactate synthase large subunit-like protein
MFVRARSDKAAVPPYTEIERPVPGEPSNKQWGSDAIAAVLRELELPYIALNPGASYRGLHDSLVNYLGNRKPEMLLCIHEETAVAIAHGYAKVTGKPLAAAVHSNVGLMHGSMAVFNAYCDRSPLILLGATGPVDAALRRPWIDWIHTSRDQGALIRPFIKWDDQPASASAAQEALLRGYLLACTAPRGPVYINLDATVQEQQLPEPLATPPAARFQPPASPEPPAEALREAARLLAGAKRPVLLAGRVSRDPAAWQTRIELAEAVGARVITDLKVGAAFPTDHPLHAAGPATLLPNEAVPLLLDADVILSLDWVDVAGALKIAYGSKPVTAKIISISLDLHGHNGWSMDYQGLPPVDVHLLTEPDVAVPPLLAAVRALRPTAPALPASNGRNGPPSLATLEGATSINVPLLATGLRAALGDREATMLRFTLSWGAHLWEFRHPLDYIGYDGGAGIGSGPGIATGAALALRDMGSGRVPIAICGDGDFMMGCTAMWTAAHYHIPFLTVVANNRSFFNDELHQERVARERGRPVANRWIGQAIREPDIDIAAIARAQGCVGIGPVTDPTKLVEALSQGIATVREGRPCVIDVRVDPGYDPAMTAAMQRVAR